MDCKFIYSNYTLMLYDQICLFYKWTRLFQQFKQGNVNVFKQLELIKSNII